MPFLIRIILQRMLFFAYSVLAFLGISPEAQIPTIEQAQKVIEERREAFVDILENQPEQTADEDTNNQDKDIDIDAVVEAITPKEVKSKLPTTPINTTGQDKPTKLSVTQPVQGLSEFIAGDNLNSVKNVVLNSICTRQEGNKITVSTGSGVLVSSEGVVLTNAHVAQFFLIQDYNDNIINCSLYRENIPTFGYKAEILYVSPEWIFDNYKLISAANAVGTGEEDYAFLHIIENTNPALPLPTTFPHANIDIDTELDAGDDVIAAGYPGAPANLIEISSAGNLKIDSIEIDDVFTFGGGDVDLITTEETIVGAKGASGGGIFLGHNINQTNLIGTISTTRGANGNAQINAITSAYINRDLMDDTSKSINYYLTGSLSNKAQSFKNVYLEEFGKLLVSEL